jgi:plasmid stabilization system protein ParE
MKRSFRLTREARADLVIAWKYLAANASAEIADRVIADIYTGMEKVGKSPGIGHSRPDLTDLPLRFYLVHRYLIIYVPKGKPLSISRVLHSARDIPSILRNDA